MNQSPRVPEALPLMAMAKELAIWAKSERDEELAATLASITEVASNYSATWDSPELLEPLPTPEPQAVYEVPLSHAQRGTSRNRAGIGIPAGVYLVVIVLILSLVLTAVFWGPVGVVVTVLIGLGLVLYDNLK